MAELGFHIGISGVLDGPDVDLDVSPQHSRAFEEMPDLDQGGPWLDR